MRDPPDAIAPQQLLRRQEIMIADMVYNIDR